ncbi:MAG: ACT domain-containing protein [Lentisphaerae bacterium]|nr:ACT domain-containing protein [Lentisphaerota bacterium]
MSKLEIAYLGPKGTFAYELARKRYGHVEHTMVSQETINDVFAYVTKRSSRIGVVPIDNSSGGTVYPTVDALLNESEQLEIQEEISIDVRLALLGRRGEKIDNIYTHFAPIKHCQKWLQKYYPSAQVIETGSTAIAAREASKIRNAAAIANRVCAGIYNMDILRHPIPIRMKNMTHFFVIARHHTQRLQKISKTSLAVRLKNRTGSLYEFLRPMADAKINLSRIISRPIEGKPREFAFLIDVDENIHKHKLSNALKEAARHAQRIKVLGSYPCFRMYHLG